MTDENLGDLPELEPIDDKTPPTSDSATPPTPGSEPSTPPPADPTAAMPPEAAGAPRQPVAGLPAPAFNPGVDKEYYRFLFAGLVMLIGCLMPFGPEWEMAGYKTLGGAFAMLVAIGMVWTWWCAIATARFSGKNLKWVGFTLLVFVFQLMNVLRAWDAPAVVDWVQNARIPMPLGWGEFFEAFFDFNNVEAQLKADNFVRAYGSGKIVVLVGALMAELFMVLAIFGGAKAAKLQKAAKREASAARQAAKGDAKGKGKRR